MFHHFNRRNKEDDTKKCINFAKKMTEDVLVSSFGEKVYQSRYQAFLRLEKAIKNKDSNTFLEWHEMADRISPGLGSVDIMRKCYTPLSKDR
jgi:hypothetical protein